MKTLISIVLLMTMLCISGQAYAAWSTDPAVNNAISTAVYDQINPTIVSDGSGGAIITWSDARSSDGYYDIYAQRIDATGNALWTTDGVPISTATNNQYSPTIASDGSGGAIITWQDSRSGYWDIYSQRIDADGYVRWTTNGVPISTAASNQHSPTIVSDGSGGAIITWYDYRSGAADIYSQRIDASGFVLWTTNGVPISTADSNQFVPTIVSDGSGGAIITWYDYRSGTADIYSQRIDANGYVLWTTNGVPISTALNNQSAPTIVSDGSGGAIITWMDSRDGAGYYDIYAQHINASGVVQWTPNGVPISTAADIQHSPTIVSDGSGGAIIAWRDSRSGSPHIYSQRIDATGYVRWTTDGVPISTAEIGQYSPAIVSDGSGGAIITWMNFRSDYWDIYVQRIDANGYVLWTTDGVSISTAVNDQINPTIVSDGSGGAIITWSDTRSNTNSDIYAQRIPASGVLGEDTYALSVSKTGTGSGTVTSSPSGINCGADCSEVYTNGTFVTLTAAPNSNSTFAGWSGDADCSDGTITMNAARNCIATFNKESNVLAIGISQGGGTGTVTVTPRGEPVFCVGIYIFCEAYPSGTIVTLTATPSSSNSNFTGWSGDADCSDGILTMDADKTCTPTFELIGTTNYNLSVSKSGTGSGTVTSSPAGINCGADCSEVYTNGTVVTLTATPDANSTFAGWSGDADCSDGVITVNAAKNCIATFNKNSNVLAIGISQGGGTGTVTVTPRGEPMICAAIYIFCEAYPGGTIVTLTATPSSNSTFAGWSGDADCSEGILTMDADKTCTPTFNLKTYTLTASVNGNGTVTSAPSGISCPSDCSEVYTHGTSVTLTASPVSGWAFTGWSGACSGTGTCIVAVTVDTSVTATFTQTWFEESDSAITYIGTWSTSSCASCSGGTMKYTSQTGAKANLSFNGAGIKWIATKSRNSGKANVYIDGAYVGTVDLDSRNTQYQVVVFEKTGLAPGNHTITIEFPGKKVTVNIDAFEVIP